MDFTRKLSFLVFLLCILISLQNQDDIDTNNKFSSHDDKYCSLSDDESHYIFDVDSFPPLPMFATTSHVERKLQQQTGARESLKYDYYHQTCPQAERIIRSSVRDLFKKRPQIAPALLRLAFHDCFVEGCDASVLLDPAEGFHSEKESPPNESLKGFDVIDIIKSELEEACPGVVSCADTVVLAARESVILTGGPFYPLKTGRRDSVASFGEVATFELPSPQDDLSKMIVSFSSKGFDEREAVSLLGAHSTGVIHCKFFINRLYNFSGTNSSDPTMNSEFVSLLRSKCNTNQASLMSPASKAQSPSQLVSSSPSPSSIMDELASALVEEPAMKMDYEGPGANFGTLYYRSLLQGRGILYVDQQLTTGEETKTWVQAYASDVSLFHKDFGLVMMKLSNLGVLTAPMGQVRKDCRKVS
ncbi:putative Peroxidase 48 [Nicotiana tabacum]|uniref:Peroxidase n=2 Tax=Nicotiana TaxID=4085 RepID=A0A1S4AI94_TOBAC|nr:PREDICTED: putative Peroxidase 48 [Nicotiana sylvestris]XP_016476412.1 PREDICTED: putative Peroxidase 48 [Nicotiana tabacum]